MDINLKDVQNWYANKINKQVVELDSYDLFCSKVAYDYACEQLNKWINVNDKMPEDNEVVLAYDGDYAMVMIYDSKGKMPWNVWSEYGVYGYEYDVEIDYENIKYWKHLNLPTD